MQHKRRSGESGCAQGGLPVVLELPRFHEIGLTPVLASNCITAVGTLSGLQSQHIGVLWLDAHGDFNTPKRLKVPVLHNVLAFHLTERSLYKRQARQNIKAILDRVQ